MGLTYTIKQFTFWGIIFLLILVLGFEVSFKEIVFIAISLEMNLAAYCIFLLASIVFLPLSFMVRLRSALSTEIMTIGDTIAFGLIGDLCRPFSGFTSIIRIKDEPLTVLWNFFMSTLWWVFLYLVCTRFIIKEIMLYFKPFNKRTSKKDSF